ncbi:hypothetical protein [Candidatus Poriferisodalis sp.]|uniref:hypothetical protein n=1 Tax=Candidatus Poriferisodalis sp. TaxID=3101277 RepID=UPI003B028E04
MPATTTTRAPFVVSIAEEYEAEAALDTLVDEIFEESGLETAIDEAVDEIFEELATELADEVPSAGEDALSSDVCAERTLGEWTVSRLRDGSCASRVISRESTGDESITLDGDDRSSEDASGSDDAESEDATAGEGVVGLVCRWVGEGEFDVEMYVQLPSYTIEEEWRGFRARLWVLPVARYASATRAWPAAEFGEELTTAEQGLLIEGADPTRVAFYPDDGAEDLDAFSATEVGDIPSVFGARGTTRFGRPLELWIETARDVVQEEQEDQTADDEAQDVPSEEETETLVWRAIFPLSGAAAAAEIVGEDCNRLNLRPTYETYDIDGFVPGGP